MERVERVVQHHHRLDRGLKGWLVNHARKNYWRVPSSYDLDDLIQEGLACYCVCYQRYNKTARNQRHFMALVQRTFSNRIHDLAAERTKLGEVLVPPDSPLLDRTEPSDALFAVLLRQLPEELKQLLHVLVHDAKLVPMQVYRDGTRESTNAYLCRLLELDPDMVNIEQVFREHFAMV